jgi:hypothetical protein
VDDLPDDPFARFEQQRHRLDGPKRPFSPLPQRAPNLLAVHGNHAQRQAVGRPKPNAGRFRRGAEGATQQLAAHKKSEIGVGFVGPVINAEQVQRPYA